MKVRIFATVSPEQLMQLQRALQRWENEGGAGVRNTRSSTIESRQGYRSNTISNHRPRGASLAAPTQTGSDA